MKRPTLSLRKKAIRRKIKRLAEKAEAGTLTLKNDYPVFVRLMDAESRLKFRELGL